MEYLEVLLQTTLRNLPPVLLAGLGGMLANRVGVLNLGLEGMMLMGSFVGVIVSFYTHSALLAILAAGLSGAVLGIIFSVLTLRFRANATVVGVSINMLALGLTTYLLSVMFGVRGSFSDTSIAAIPKVNLDFLAHVPVLNALNGQAITVYVALLAVVLLQYVLYKTPLGLRVRATGYHKMAVTTAGVNSDGIQYGALILSGFLCGLGGVHLSLGQLTMFTENMTSGRGFIAMAATIFGRNTPVGTLLGSLLFSVADAVTRKAQTSGFPSMLVDMIPYLVTVITLWIVAADAMRKAKKVTANG